MLHKHTEPAGFSELAAQRRSNTTSGFSLSFLHMLLLQHVSMQPFVSADVFTEQKAVHGAMLCHVI